MTDETAGGGAPEGTEQPRGRGPRGPRRGGPGGGRGPGGERGRRGPRDQQATEERAEGELVDKLVSINRKCKADQTTLKMCNISPDIMKVFEITRLNKVIDIHESEEKAISAFNKRGWFG